MEPGLQEGCGPAGLLGYLGPHPWLFEAAWEPSSQPPRLATAMADHGVLGSPTLAVWRTSDHCLPRCGQVALSSQRVARESVATVRPSG